MNDLTIYLNNFLDVINYEGNREEFINKLLLMVYVDAIEDAMLNFPQGKQDVIKQQLSSVENLHQLQEIVNNFESNVFQTSLKKTSQKVLSDYLKMIENTLTSEQIIKLQQFVASSSTHKI